LVFDFWSLDRIVWRLATAMRQTRKELDMLSKGPAKRVTVFVNEDTRHGTEPLWRAIFDLLVHKQAAGATVTRPLMGFGSHHRVHSPDMEAQMEHLPIRIEFVDTAERVEELLPTLYDLVNDGLIEVQDTTVIKVAQKEQKPEAKIAHTRTTGSARLMRIFLGEADKWHGESLYDAIVKRLRMEDIAGATVYKGLLGYGAKGHTHKSQSFFHLAHDSPVMISVIDSEEKIKQAVGIVEGMLEDGLVVISDVEVIRLAHPSLAMEVRDAGNADR
jgi:PII-like signaling protein